MSRLGRNPIKFAIIKVTFRQTRIWPLSKGAKHGWTDPAAAEVTCRTYIRVVLTDHHVWHYGNRTFPGAGNFPHVALMLMLDSRDRWEQFPFRVCPPRHVTAHNVQFISLNRSYCGL